VKRIDRFVPKESELKRARTHVFGTGVVEELDQVLSGNNTTVYTPERNVRTERETRSKVDGTLTNACRRTESLATGIS
jgi:hypothetical protein